MTKYEATRNEMGFIGRVWGKPQANTGDYSKELQTENQGSELLMLPI